jgi:hypothetical protein
LGAVVFLLTGVGVLWGGASLEDEAPPPLYAPAERATPASDGTFQVTLEVSDRDQWRGFSFGLGQPVASPAEGDIALKRYQMRAPAGAADLGPVELAAAPVDDTTEWVDDREVSGQLQSPVLSSWYTYSYLSHRLLTKGHSFAVRRLGGGLAVVQILSYYCQPDRAGCLTLRYRLLP